MLIKELIAHHIGPNGALHERGIRLDEGQVPPGVRVHHDGVDVGPEATGAAGVAVDDDLRPQFEAAGDVVGPDAGDAQHGAGAVRPDGGAAVATVSGDLVIVRAPVGPGLKERVDTDLSLGVHVVLLFEVEATELPVDRILAALAAAKLQVVAASVVSGTPTPTVAVVATRTDELVVPEPPLAQNLEPGDHVGSAVLQRLVGEHVLQGLVRPARDRALQAQVAELEARVAKDTAELDKLGVDARAREAALVRERDTARKDADAERKHLQKLRASRSFKVASRLTQVSGVARKVIRRPGSGKPLA